MRKVTTCESGRTPSKRALSRRASLRSQQLRGARSGRQGTGPGRGCSGCRATRGSRPSSGSGRAPEQCTRSSVCGLRQPDSSASGRLRKARSARHACARRARGSVRGPCDTSNQASPSRQIGVCPSRAPWSHLLPLRGQDRRCLRTTRFSCLAKAAGFPHTPLGDASKRLPRWKRKAPFSEQTSWPSVPGSSASIARSAYGT